MLLSVIVIVLFWVGVNSLRTVEYLSLRHSRDSSVMNRVILNPLSMCVTDKAQPNIRIGHGYDIHRLIESDVCKLVIAGVTIPHSKGAEAHSDGDAVYHRFENHMPDHQYPS